MPVINMIRTGENIRALRVRCGLSVRDLQAIFGFGTPQAIYKWQQGTSLPTIDNLVILARVFGVPIEAIVAVDGPDLIIRRATA